MKRPLLCIAIALLFAACSPVPYDAGLAESAKTLLKMTQDNPGIVTAAFGYDPAEYDFTFYPRVTSAGFDYGMGFICSTDGSRIKVRGMSYQPEARMLKEFDSYVTTLINQDPRMPSWSVWPTKDNPAYNSFVFLLTFDSLYPRSSNSFALAKGQIGSPPVFSLQANNLNSQISGNMAGFNTEVLGGSVDADTDVTKDNTYWLVRQAAGSLFAELMSPVWSTGVSVASLRSSYPYTLSFIPAGITRLQYFHDENQAGDPARLPNASFASWYDSTAGKWICYRWAEDPPGSGIYPNTQIPIDHRVDAMLSTGQLLSTESGTGRLYNRDGVLLAAFPLGTLRFLAEEYVGGEARTYFCQYLPYDGEIHFNVYWIRTSALSSLAS